MVSAKALGCQCGCLAGGTARGQRAWGRVREGAHVGEAGREGRSQAAP